MKAKEQKLSLSQINQSQRKYDATFKQEVLKMIDNGRSVSKVAQSLGVGENLIYQWRAKRAKKVELTATVEVKELLSEVQLRREKLRQSELEREIWTSRRCQHRVLKKPCAFSAALPRIDLSVS